jgi:hypothetical protein
MSQLSEVISKEASERVTEAFDVGHDFLLNA